MRRAGGQRRGRHRRRATRPRRCAWPSSTSSYFQGPLAEWDVRRPAPAAPHRSRRTACASTTCARVIETLADTGSVLELRRALRPRHGHGADPHRGPPDRRHRQQPDAPRRRHRQRRRRQGRALHAAVRRLRHPAPVPVRHAGHHGRARRSRRPRSCATAAGCSSPAPTSPCPFFTIVAAQGATASARRRWPAAASRRRSFTVAWPTGEFGGMGLEGAVKLGYRNELAAIEDPDERLAALRARWSPRRTSTARRINQARVLRDRRRDRSHGHAPLGGERPAFGRPAATGRQAPPHRRVVSGATWRGR